MEKLYTIRDACKILQIHPTTLRVWDRGGKIRCVRMQNNFRRVPESEIKRILGIQGGKFHISMRGFPAMDRRMISKGR